MFYDRRIKYLDYLVKGERCGNAGFIKFEVRDTVCNITINVNGLRTTDSLSVKVWLVGAGQERELCILELLQGKGMMQLLRQNAKNLGSTGIAYENLEAVRIPVSAEREIIGVIGTVESVGQVDREEVPIYTAVPAEVTAAAEPETEVVPEELIVHIQEDSINEQSVSLIERDEKTEKPTAPAEREAPVRQPEECKEPAVYKEKKIPLCDNKWKQLWEIYPHITPFRDEREYLSVGPNDFVILPEKYFRMANNSFLLHGYYNYKHLVLKKLEYRGETRYYIGVPGNFYDREKQVALMFGFESFESLEEPAGIGDYGYYLMRIEL